ncbi:MAG: exosortase/archaeosortase family protein [Verrucomicrobiaceae bacterium]|nr:exosortase/archaeosortase family protein [Verrucomicrobiaceae bacterium]
MKSKFIPCSLLAISAALLTRMLPYAAGYGAEKKTILANIAMYWQNPTWQHGALALPVALFILWRRREQIAAVPARPSNVGFAIVILGLLFYFLGYLANIFYFGYAGIMLVAAGMAVALMGLRRAWEGVFPWLMLGFAFPLIFLESSLAIKLRYLMLDLTSGVLSLLGVGVVQEGTSLLSPPNAAAGRELGDVFSLNIEGPCSGMRSLFALMFVGALFSYFRQNGLLQRWVLFFTTFPLAIIANMVRILILLGTSTFMGQEFAIGSAEQEVSTFHFLTGIVTFLVALAGLQSISWLMDRFWSRKPQTGARTVSRRVSTAVP